MVRCQQVLRNGGATRLALHAGLDERRSHNEVAVAIDDYALPGPLVHLPELAATHLHAGEAKHVSHGIQTCEAGCKADIDPIMLA